ncbi:MAG: hypothetical protein GX329_04000 [Tissierellia bacterium]|nr:hypothetical protein [Tissierellia bacterium]
MNISLISLLAIIFVFVIGAFKRNPLHLGLLGLLITYIIGRIGGFTDVEIMAFFPTTLFVRVFGIMLFFGTVQANGAMELLARKLLSKTDSNIKLLPFYIFFIGILMGTIGVNSLAGIAILSGIGISLALTSGGDPLLFGIAGGYGVVAGCYSPINEFTANIITAVDSIGLNTNLFLIFMLAIVTFTISFAIIYFIMGGHRAEGGHGDLAKDDIPDFNRDQTITLLGILGILVLVIFLGIDVGWAGLIVTIICILLGACRSTDSIRNVSLVALILISGVGALINLVSELGGFELMSTALASIMNGSTVAPVMSMTSSVMSLFTIARLCVLTLIPTIPGIIESVPGASIDLAVIAISVGSLASSIGPLSSNGALIMQNLSQQLGEEEAANYFTKQMIMGVIGGINIALALWVISLLNIF